MPVLLAQFEYVEWTPDNRQRHSSFIALTEDRDARVRYRVHAKHTSASRARTAAIVQVSGLRA